MTKLLVPHGTFCQIAIACRSIYLAQSLSARGWITNDKKELGSVVSMNKILQTPKYLVWIALPILALLLVALTYSSRMAFSDFQLTGKGDDGKSVSIPYLEQGSGPGDYQLEGNIQLSWLGPRALRIIPDDQVLALNVNGHAVDLSDINPDRLRNVQRGFEINLGEYLQTGSNSIVIEFRDFGGQIGMSFKRGYGDLRSGALIFAWSLLFLFFFVFALRGAGISTRHSIFYLLVVVGSIIQVWYIFTYNPVDHIWSDPARHWEQGIDTLRIDLMSLTDPIGYQLYIGALAKLTLKIPALVAYFTCLLALLAPWLWYRFSVNYKAVKPWHWPGGPL